MRTIPKRRNNLPVSVTPEHIETAKRMARAYGATRLILLRQRADRSHECA